MFLVSIQSEYTHKLHERCEGATHAGLEDAAWSLSIVLEGTAVTGSGATAITASTSLTHGGFLCQSTY
jgi:hypothetical protein